MKRVILLACLFSLSFAVSAQKTISGTSRKGYVSITKDPPKPPYLEIIQNSLDFSDVDGNRRIDGGESTYIKFMLENTGTGPGLDLKVTVRLLNTNPGVQFPVSTRLAMLEPGKTRQVEIPVKGSMDITNGIASFEIVIDEANGFDSDPVKIDIPTRSFRAPLVKVVDYKVSSQSGTSLQKRRSFDLQILVQNIGEGVAKDISVILPLPSNIYCLSGNENINIGTLEAGSQKLIDYTLITNNEYSSNTITFRFGLSEKYDKYSEDRNITLNMNQEISANKMVVQGKDEVNTVINIGSLTSAVDKNIPFNPNKRTGRFALIIGNENYSNYGTLNAEINVDYARNDASVFREYAINMLGVEERNVFTLYDATAGKMRGEIDRFTKLIKKYGPSAEVIFYYAGHGYPDEQTKVAYIMPIDVNAANISYAIPLSELYKKLAATGAVRISVFMDACFSGGGRNKGLLASRGALIKPKEEIIDGNMVVFSASSGEQTSLPYKKEKHGMFTYFLLKKLQDTEGNVNYSEMAGYLKRHVAIESLRENGKSQDPEVNVSLKVENTWKSWNFR